MDKTYEVSKTFTDGTLEGVTIKERTDVYMEPGKRDGGPWTGGGYVVNWCVPTCWELDIPEAD